MKNRLEVAKEFLSDDGVIFVSIDDNEQAYLKVLMDEIFGRNNTETMVWHKVGDDSGRLKITKRFRREHEYICIAYNNKQKVHFTKYLSDRNYKNKYTNPDNDPRGEYKQGIISHTEDISKKTGKNYYNVKIPSGRIISRQWRVTELEFNKLRDDNRIYFGKKGDSIPSLKVFIGEKKETTPISILSELGTAKSAGIDLEKLFGSKVFPYLKPEELIERLIHISTKSNDIVMDFHLGSGTTCAVAHKMGRRYIGIEQMDYIEDITVERMKKVIDGEQGGISKAVDWQGGGSFIYAELKETDEFQNSKVENMQYDMRYIPYSEIDDETYKINNKEKEINIKFYGVDNE
jgi:adenine-specific DNA-methyltransferase